MRTLKRKHLIKILDSLNVKVQCALCDLGTKWNGKPLTLPIDHIDGNPSNNDPKNLRYLCPNCHSQTDTFAGKGSRKPKKELSCPQCNQKFLVKRIRKYCTIKCANEKNKNRNPYKINWPSHNDLRLLVEENGFVGTGKLLGVSDAAVHKRLKNFSE